jgi:hypothetical protein
VTLGLELMLHLVLLRSAEHATAALVNVIVLATEALETVGMQIIDQVKSLCCTGQSYWTTKSTHRPLLEDVNSLNQKASWDGSSS